jgi:hypothetical protein
MKMKVMKLNSKGCLIILPFEILFCFNQIQRALLRVVRKEIGKLRLV